MDPLESVLIEFGKFRAKVAMEAIKLPAPDPMHGALKAIDNLLSDVEINIEEMARKASPLEALQRVISHGPGPFIRGKTFYAEAWRPKPPGDILKKLTGG